LGFFLSLLLHLFLIGGLLWLGRDLSQTPQEIEPNALVLDLTRFDTPSRPSAHAPAPSGHPREHLPEKTAPTPLQTVEKNIRPAVLPLPAPVSAAVKPNEQKQAPNIYSAPTMQSKAIKKSTIAPKAIAKITRGKTHPTKPRLTKKRAAKQRASKKRFSPAASQASARRRFIRHHLGRIMRISQQTLLRLGIPRIHSRRRHVRATASFRLHPDGSISGLHLSHRSGIGAINRRTLQVIRRAHRRYPRPSVPVQVRITMRYGL
jgi:TonB family protein